MSVRVHYSEALGVRTIDDEDRFDINCDLLNEFFTLRRRYPKRTGVGLEHKLALFIKDMRQNYNHMKNNRPDRIKKLDDIHPGILDKQIKFDAHIEPSDEWQVVFDEWAKNTPKGAIDAFTFPTIADKYVGTARSFQEHIIIKTGCYRLFQPSECNPYTSTPGTMQHVVCYLLYPSQMKDTLFDERPTFGSELVALRIARDLIVELRIKLKCFGVPLDGPTNVMCDNNGVVKNTSIPESTLNKKHNSINYHVVREAAAAGILRVGKEDTKTNLADALTKLLPYSKKMELLGGLLYDY